jgi:Mg-chelatase subunit ChlD
MAKRALQTFSMSFLDVIACGFGSVVLLYTILSAQSGVAREKLKTEDLAGEVSRIEKQVEDGRLHLADLRNALQKTDEEKVKAAGLSRQMLDKLRMTEEEMAQYDKETLARRESLERLQADLKQLEEGTRRLKEKAPPASGSSDVRIADPQQLVTLRIGGQRVLVLVDASASMLDETVVNIIRLRNMPPERRISSAKWQQAVSTVEWVAARLPQTTQFQVYAFDTEARPLVAGSDGRWLNTKDAGQIALALKTLRSTAPTGGTSLENAFAVIGKLSPAPDNVILITDGLPTQGDKPPLIRRLVTAEEREDLMKAAVKSLPLSPPPISIVLLPMEGDPSAPIYFWRLARSTGGGFLSPAKDWP